MRPSKRRKVSPPEDEAAFQVSGEDSNEEDEVNDAEENDDGELLDSEDDGISDRKVETELSRPVQKNESQLNGKWDGKPRDNSSRKPSRMAGESTTYMGELYKSNVFKMQLDGLLDQAIVKPGKTQLAIETTLKALKKIIEQIPAREPLPIAEAEKSLIKGSKVAVPFPDPRPPKDAKYEVRYQKPAHINVVGSFAHKVLSRSKEELGVDLVVIMPAAMFQDKDYMDYRYFYRRAYYIACIAAGIKESGQDFTLLFETLNGNPLHPILVVVPTREDGEQVSSKFRIQIIPSIPETVFPMERTLPIRSRVRHQHVEGSDPSASFPTPFYNASIRADALVTTYLKTLHETATACDSFKDACILGRVWLRKRGFGAEIRSGGFGSFEWAALMALLLQNGRSGGGFLSYGYSSYQLFKGTIQFLASRDLIKNPYFGGKQNINIPSGSEIPYAFDAVNGINLLYKMSDQSYKVLHYEAQNSVSMLGDGLFDQFDAAFVQDVCDPAYQYDTTITLPVSTLSSTQGRDEDAQLSETCSKLYGILSRALTDRVRIISIKMPKRQPWQLSSARSESSPAAQVQVGLSVEPAKVSRSMEYGPSKDDKEDAKAFRQFWGTKSELRQFNDLRVLESVRWEEKASGPSILEQIISYVLARHMGQKVSDAATIRVDFLSTNAPSRAKIRSHLSREYSSILDAFSVLERDIRGLEDLPLQVRRLVASDAMLRYASIQPPASTPNQPLARSADVNLQFEGSTRWPEDLGAIQRTKIAFLLKLSDLLTSTYPNIVARVGIENVSNAMLNQNFLDITYPSNGYTFRLRIQHEREATLLERLLKIPSQAVIEKEHIANALATYKRDFVRRPDHTQALRTLCTRFPSLAPAIRLTKIWFASHLLLDQNHVCDELVELLVARTFTNPWPWGIPGSASTAFARTLSWIARWDWKTEPLIVDFSAGANVASSAITGETSSGMKAADVTAIHTRLEAWRRIDPAMNRVVLFAASSADGDGATWTDHARPAKVVVSRMTSLARAASKMLSSDGFETKAKLLFQTATADFDFVMKLDSKVAKKSSSDGDKSNGVVGFKNLEMQGVGQDTIETMDFQPAKLFLDELRLIYGDAVVFFYDESRTNAICGLWNPARNQRSWKIRLGISSMPAKASQKQLNGSQGGEKDDESTQFVLMNKQAILNDIARLGGDMIRKIEIVKAID